MVGALLLTHGAGSGREHPTLVALESGLAPMPVVRIDFPYRRAGRRAPDRADRLIACIREEAAAASERLGIAPQELALGGRSLGGRMCSLAVAEGLPCAGLVLLSYPLHPPGRPERLRVEHFPRLEVPCFFLAGDRDPFGSPEEVERHVAAIPGPTDVSWIPGGRHDVKGHDGEIVRRVRDWLTRGSI